MNLDPEPTIEVLDASSVPRDPISLFKQWFEDAISARPGDWFDPTAMTLATATRNGIPSARIVLLKHYDGLGFIFYTNYASRKGMDISENPHTALAFHWPMLKRQVRISGVAAKVSRDESIRYFHSRPRGSQLGATAADQSKVVADRYVLDDRLAELDAKFAGGPIPLPPDWGGYRVMPREIEFWLNRPNRLHDRIRYTRQDDDRWLIERLAP